MGKDYSNAGKRCGDLGLPEGLPKKGETFYMGSVPYTMMKPLVTYMHNINDTAYSVIAKNGNLDDWCIITHKRLLGGLDKLVVRYVTLQQLLEANPCRDGLDFVAHILGGAKGLSAIELAVQIGKVNKCAPFSTQNLYEYADVFTYGHGVPTNWLNFVAKVLKLIPEESNMNNRAALKRLLGIKEDA